MGWSLYEEENNSTLFFENEIESESKWGGLTLSEKSVPIQFLKPFFCESEIGS